MIDRRRFIRATGAGIAIAAMAAEAQQAPRLPRIGVLYPWKIGIGTEVLRQGLQELGYVEGRTAVIEWRWWEGNPTGCATRPRRWCDSIRTSSSWAVPRRLRR